MTRNITDLLNQHDGVVSFVQVAALPDARGEEHIAAGPNVVLWQGLSTEVVEALRQMQGDGLIQIIPTHPLVYACDGEILRLPVVQKRVPRAGYRRPRWCPAVVQAVTDERKRWKRYKPQILTV